MKFILVLEGDLELDVDELWPDGDAPVNPTDEDVIELLKTLWPGAASIAREVGLPFTLTVNGKAVAKD